MNQAIPPLAARVADDTRVVAMGRQVLEIEAAAVASLARRIGPEFCAAVALILESRGRVVVSGIGKSGHIARKLAATFASTGTPAYFVHAAEAVHGDLGMITRDDVLIAISNSGENDELLTIVPLVKRLGGKLIAITGNETSSLAQEADIHLDARVDQEACPLNLAPTASTTAALALGDALAVALLDARGFGADDFARSHPGGALGRKLLTIVPLVKRLGGKLIAITGNETSSLAQEADVHLDARVDQEACPLNLAPTASTTAALALGDALAVALLDARGFDADDFARSHPGGALGRKLLTHVADVMRVEVPTLAENAPIPAALAAMTRGGMGMAVVLDAAARITGIFTDGDLRRAMERLGDLRSVPVSAVMTRNPRSIAPRRLAVEAVEMMEANKVNQLLVTDDAGRLCGALNMHDLFRAKVV